MTRHVIPERKFRIPEVLVQQRRPILVPRLGRYFRMHRIKESLDSLRCLG